MSLTKTLEYVCEVDEPVLCRPIRTALMAGDGQAHEIRVKLTRAGLAESTDGIAVTGYMLRADDTTVMIRGSTANGYLSVTLPADCYAVPGRFHFILRGTKSDVVSTLLWLEGHVSVSASDAVISPDGALPSLEALLAQLDRLAAATLAAQDAAAQAEAAAARVPESFGAFLRCYTQAAAPENPIPGTVWISGPSYQTWADVKTGTWNQLKSGAWNSVLMSLPGAVRIFDGLNWRTLSAA